MRKKKFPRTVTQLNDLHFSDPQSETRSTLLPGGPAAPELLFDKYKWVSNGVNITHTEQLHGVRVEYLVRSTLLRVTTEFSLNHARRIHLDNLLGIKYYTFWGFFLVLQCGLDLITTMECKFAEKRRKHRNQFRQ